MVRWLCCVVQMTLALMIALLAVPGCAKNRDALLGPPPVEEPGPPVGSAAPEIDGEDMDGAPLRLSDYRGQIVLLDFWGNW